MNISEIINKFQEYNKAYYVDGNPIISDSEYDLKKQELKNLMWSSPEYKDKIDQILNQVGVKAPATKGFTTSPHVRKMLSLNAVYDESGFKKWTDTLNGDLIAQPKLDGLSIELVYKYGSFLRAVTRGDGFEGDDVTENIKATKEVPLFVPDFRYIDKMIIYGEVIINKDDFNNYLSTKFKNARNAAVGSLKSLDSTVIPSRYLRVYVYDMYTNQTRHKHGLLSDFLEKNCSDFRICPFNIKLKSNEASKLFDTIRMVRDTYNIEMDGVVFKLDDIMTKENMGAKTNYPLGALAWKFNSMITNTVIKDVKWSMGKTGNLTPVLKTTPVDLCGVTITNINVHNIDYMNELDLKINDSISIRRAGDVIPEVINVIKEERANKTVKDIEIPSLCPYCNNKLVVVPGNTTILNCNNKDCTEQIILKLKHFASKEAVNIEGMSVETIRVLVNDLGVKKPEDLYNLDYDKLKTLPRFGERKVENIKQAIEKSKDIDVDKFIYSLGIPALGISTINKIVDVSPIEFNKLTYDEIMDLKIPDVGTVVATNIDEFNKNNDITDLLKIFTIKKKQKTSSSTVSHNFFKDKRVVFTGGIMGMPRTLCESYIHQLGGVSLGSVTQITDYLVVGDKAGSKVDKAKRYNIPTIKGSEFETMCEEYIKQGLIKR